MEDAAGDTSDEKGPASRFTDTERLEEDRDTASRHPLSPNNYFLGMDRREVWHWHWNGLRSVFQETGLGDTAYQLVHHRNCYGYLVKHASKKRDDKGYLIHAVDGVQMADYMEIYQRVNVIEINHRDQAKLNQMTNRTLFCNSCFQPFPLKNYHKELTNPFLALVDFVSAMFIPIGLIPMLFVMPILIVYENVVKWTNDDNDAKEVQSKTVMK